MMDKKVAYAIGVILAVCVLILVFIPQAKAETYPTWVGEVSTGTTDILSDGDNPSPSPLSYIEAAEVSSWIGSFWGRNHEGDLVRVCPMYGAGTDTTISIVVGAGLEFTGIRIEEIRTVSGTATMWGE